MRNRLRTCGARAVLALVLCSLLLRRTAAQSLSDHFWMNAGGGGLNRFGADRTDVLVGESRVEVASEKVRYSWSDAVSSARVGGSFGWNLPVESDGEYLCGFHFAEFMGKAPGERVFEVSFNGVSRTGVDVAAQVGGGAGWALWLKSMSSGGVLSISLKGQVGEAMLGALTCSRVGADPGPAPDASASPVPSAPPKTEQPTGPPATQPPTESPATQQPTETPATQPPTLPPGTQSPTEPPGTQPPTEPPGTQPPTEPPGTQQPTQPPATQSPTQPPATQPPTEPSTSQPSTEPPTTEPPNPAIPVPLAPIEPPEGSTTVPSTDVTTTLKEKSTEPAKEGKKSLTTGPTTTEPRKKTSTTAATTTKKAKKKGTTTTTPITTEEITTEEVATSVAVVPALVDPPLALEDDEFAQRFDMEVDISGDRPFASNDVGAMKVLLSEGAKSGEARDWALAKIEDGVAVPTQSRFVLSTIFVRQEGGLYRYAVSMLGRFPKGDEGRKAFDNVVDFVGNVEGKATVAFQEEGFTDVTRVGWADGKAPTLSAEAEKVAGRKGDEVVNGDEGGSGVNIGAVVGGILGGIALLVLLGAVAFFALKRRGEAHSRDYDSPPPPEASIVAVSEYDGTDVEGGSVYLDGDRSTTMDDRVSYMEDPDSRLTGATSEGGFGDEHSSVGINKDVWGRGTGSDY